MSVDAPEVDPIDLGQLLLLLADNGFAAEVGSWVSVETPNQPITGEQLLGVLELQEAATGAGMSVHEYADQLAQALPAAANAVTPEGELPEDDEFKRHLQDFCER
ncbi:hypothetical protein ATK36_1111 [Amycolatopsis sulphurea]|uniref:Uncharacterized protein n=1 Tax=Amycolatopsis sulphurea TaxID=76022 RepID=A0A2A9G3P7_9PSEU|nr:YidB family protein [Amycolatopsis sulphurea]PFG57521.1 hypothetical protein ATK36_1111 [Amycolatopsis sulphurea]